MLNLENGTITLEKSGVVLSQSLTVSEFVGKFPASQIRNSREIGNGYVWYYFTDDLLGEPFYFSGCFSPEGYLVQINLYPDKKEVIEDKDIWSIGRLEKDKAYNDKWLLKVCGTNKTDNVYAWGRVVSCMEKKGWSSHILIRYDI